MTRLLKKGEKKKEEILLSKSSLVSLLSQILGSFLQKAGSAGKSPNAQCPQDARSDRSTTSAGVRCGRAAHERAERGPVLCRAQRDHRYGSVCLSLIIFSFINRLKGGLAAVLS